jgi:O-acetyl-ADP-ribose deacetylase (regulator of RNase III)
MKIAHKNLFEFKCDAICIPTNGFVSSDGNAVMGAGVARQAVEKFGKETPKHLADSILRNGHHVRPFMVEENYRFLDYDLLSFPTKPGKIYPGQDGWSVVLPQYRRKSDAPTWLPGWQGFSRIDIIRHSALELAELAKQYRYRKVVLPRVGGGAGGLDFEGEVRPILEEILDDKFVLSIR